MRKATLILCIHNHQPVGNLPAIFEQAYRDAYLPFLDAVERHPTVKLVLHNTGPLLEWYEEHAPDYIDRVRALVARGQVEVLTGGFYEPILPAIPERDARGQIARMTRYVEDRFGMRPRGMWLAERVWEPRLAKTIADAGVEYVPLDDYEFKLAGLRDEDLVGHFVTEEQGVPLGLFPISKRLRYAIPFAPPEETLGILRSLADRGAGLMALFGDDGEKFGIWPGTHAHVYRGGWLERFLCSLEESSSWLETSTLAEFVDRERPRGRAYLPTASYPEMMEWALPTPARRAYERLQHRLKEQGSFEEWGSFLAGGTWKGFLAKYDEANLMTRKMMRVSGKVAAAARAVQRAAAEPGVGGEPVVPEAAVAPDALAEARDELWRGQCNCAYWHGVFGGLYLPHLRAAVYHHLIRAERLLDSGRRGRWDAVDVVDHDLDGDEEVLLESHWANVYVSPARGGAVFEIDARRSAVNLLGTMSRYDEAYHSLLSDASEGRDETEGGVASIHDAVRVKERGLSRLARPDRHPRRSAVDRFVDGGSFATCDGSDPEDRGDFRGRRYGAQLRRENGAVGVAMTADGTVDGSAGSVPVSLRKTVWLSPDDAIRVEHAVAAPEGLTTVFASEWNLAFLTSHSDYLYLEDSDGVRTGVASPLRIDERRSVRLVDVLSDQVVSLEASPGATFCVRPLETVSQSEGGFERVFQGLCVLVCWPLTAARGGRAEFVVSLRFGPIGGVTP